MSISHQALFAHLQSRYCIEKELGRGNMGVVYLAVDQRLERPVAIKVLSSAKLSDKLQRDELTQRFHREARMLARISHPNLVTVFEAGQHEDEHYMVMEYIAGSPLSRFIKARQKLSHTLVASLGKQLCDALQRIHQEGIIHRDVKPDNMILSPQGQVKLADFGVALMPQSPEHLRLTQAGALMGSLIYCAPEQVHNALTVDARADIYALGVSLYELLAQFTPYQSQHLVQLTAEITSPQSHGGRLRARAPELPDALVQIIEKALAKAPEDRYQSAALMGEALSAFMQEHLRHKKIYS